MRIKSSVRESCTNYFFVLSQLAEEAAKGNREPVLIKKMYVLAALEVERYHQIQKTKKGGREEATAALDGLLAEDAKNSLDPKFLDSAWRGAEAYHFYLLAQRQFYNGDLKAAVKTVSTKDCILWMFFSFSDLDFTLS
jgi:WD repeat-containing protein 35